MALLTIDSGSELPTPPNCHTVHVSSGYQYYHYCCDSTDDRVWVVSFYGTLCMLVLGLQWLELWFLFPKLFKVTLRSRFLKWFCAPGFPRTNSCCPNCDSCKFLRVLKFLSFGLQFGAYFKSINGPRLDHFPKNRLSTNVYSETISSKTLMQIIFCV